MAAADTVFANPFALMMNPECVLEAMEASERLGRLKSRVYRPLDRPLIPKMDAADVDAFDRDIDLADDIAGDILDDISDHIAGDPVSDEE